MDDKITKITKFIFSISGRKILISYFYVFIASILEILAIASIFPLIKILVSNGNDIQINYINNVFGYLSSISSELAANKAGVLIAIIIVAFFLKAIFSYFAFSYAAKLRAEFIFKLRRKIVDNLKNSNYEDYLQKDAGTFINLANEQSARAGYCFYLVSQFYSNLLISITFLLATFYVSMVFGSLMLIIGLVVKLLFVNMNKKVARYSGEMVDNSSTIANLVGQFFNSFKYLKATNNVENIARQIKDNLVFYSGFQQRTGRAEAFTLSSREPFLIVSLFLISYVYLTAFGGNIDSLLVSTILIYKSINSYFVVQRTGQSVLEYSGGIFSVKDALRQNVSTIDKNQRKGVITCENGIEFKNVDFKFESSESFILKDINMYIKKNTSVAFVGASGSGKTTLIDLISNLLQPTNGDVLYDGKKIAAHSLWKDGVGYVAQDPYLYNDTIESNISMKFGIELNKDEKNNVVNSSKKAHAHEFIEKLPNTYKATIGKDGLDLSGGQKQRVIISREFYANPGVIFFDEATSALDAKAEEIVNKHILSLRGKKTVIAITHRIKTLENFDHIFVLKNGAIFEEGSYSELIKIENSYLNGLLNKHELK